MCSPISPPDLQVLLLEADVAARRLCRKLRLSRDELADLRQDLLTDLIARYPAFDPISRMEVTIRWFAWLEPIDSRIVWLRASGSRWKSVCWTVGLARAAAHEHWRYALCLIAWRLNGKDRLQHVGRRRMIAHARASGGARQI